VTRTLVYRYGLAATHENAQLVHEQMRLAHEYHKRLVEIERARRADSRAVMAASSAELRAAEESVRAADAECERLAGEIRAARKQTRKRSETEEMRVALATEREAKRTRQRELYAIREKQRAQCFECRSARLEEIPCPHASEEARALRLALDAIDTRALGEVRQAREASGVFWGTYLIVEKAARASFGAPLYAQDCITPHDPAFPRWTGDGAVAIQLQGGLSLEDATRGDDTRLRLRCPPWPEEWLSRLPAAAEPVSLGRLPPGHRPDGSVAPATRADGTPARWVRDHAAREGELRMRISSDGRDPIWASWRLDYARSLPQGAVISWAIVYRRMRGPHAEWSVCVTAAVQQPAPKDITGKTIAIDLGWRVIGEELRVAAWQDSEGMRGELRLSAADIRTLRQPEQIRGDRDTAFDLCKLRLHRWVAASPNAPEWMRVETATVPQWRDPRRMVALLRKWAEQPSRTPDEDLVYRAVEAWALADYHLWEQETARRTWALRRRRDKYRVFAAHLARKNDTIVIEAFDLRVFAQRAETGQDDAENETARSNRQMAAVSELRDAILHAAANYGATVVEVSAVDTTRTHAICGVVADRDVASDVMVYCDVCHATFDQDLNAADILLSRYRERPGDAKIIVGARDDDNSTKQQDKSVSKWARAKRMGKAKAARLAAARKEAGYIT
jgi:hypothetical protein